MSNGFDENFASIFDGLVVCYLLMTLLSSRDYVGDLEVIVRLSDLMITFFFSSGWGGELDSMNYLTKLVLGRSDIDNDF